MLSVRVASAVAGVVLVVQPVFAQTPPVAVPETGYQDGFFVQTSNGDYRLVFGAIAQLCSGGPARLRPVRMEWSASQTPWSIG